MINNLSTQNKSFGLKFRATKSISIDECEYILGQTNINSKQLEQLIEAREENIINFNLIDVREWVEWVGSRIKFTNYLIPTTSFYEALKQIENEKEVPTVIYCHVGQRSAYCQKVMRELGFKTVVNLLDGIAGYHGNIISGK